MRTWNTVAIVGVGLIGGSLGLSLRQQKLARQVVGIGRREASLAKAKKVGAIDHFTTNLAQGIAQAELVILAGPVEAIPVHAQAVAQHAPNGCLITDVGSTKYAIVNEIEALLAQPNVAERKIAFVGSHPLAGSEKTGPTAAKANLFASRMVVVTPTEKTPKPALAAIKQLWKSLGARVMEMSAREHDAAVAATSHLPHVLAAALAASTREELLPLVASGWLDTTRVAAGNAELWRQILTSNRPHVLNTLANFAKVLTAFRRALAQKDDTQLVALLESGKRIRDSVGS